MYLSLVSVKQMPAEFLKNSSWNLECNSAYKNSLLHLTIIKTEVRLKKKFQFIVRLKEEGKT